MATDIVLDPNLIHFIYRMVVRAASASLQEASRSTPYYSIAAIGARARSEAMIIAAQGIAPVIYHPDDITIVGGSALIIYDQQFAGFKQRHQMFFRTLREEIQRETHDVDMVWWPRLTSPRQASHIFTAESPAIIEFVDRYIQRLQEESKSFPMQMVPGMTGIAVYSLLIRPAGVHMVHIDFMFGTTRVKAVELAIHDNGNSQRVSHMGEPITELQPMEMDPMYCTADTKKRLTTTTFRGTKPAIPHLYTLFYQQIFLYNYLKSVVPPQDEKRKAVNRRIIYLYKIIVTYISQHTDENLKNMKRAFGLQLKEEDIEALFAIMSDKINVHKIPLVIVNENSTDNHELQAIESAVRENVAHLSNRQKQEALTQLMGGPTAAAYAHGQPMDEMKYADVQENVQENNNEMKAFLANVRRHLSAERRENNQKEGGYRRRMIRNARKRRATKRRATKRHVKSTRRSRPSSR